MEYLLIAVIIILLLFIFRRKPANPSVNITVAKAKEHPRFREIEELLEQDKDVHAIKRARELYGLSLVDGKKLVDELKQEKG
ncbi:ribosomal protein L7/L12 [Alkalihalobacillus xiaoxiensis]|uniref:Ribosomal protein L7/L12 n=1 Tax=Shouchella xiaoxiensis TaxID=766895 RepID=A0ABS2SQ37_9BACI|nr:hypothetical protein [Shouchella xiaoxiensis]MBM7836925.1 ribosomal protein L7/L12 [Shouchella xiaoxiensis]